MGWPIKYRDLLAIVLLTPAVLFFVAWLTPVTEYLAVTKLDAELSCAAVSTVAGVVAFVMRLPRRVVALAFLPLVVMGTFWLVSIPLVA